ncbi:MAG: hypothetical protein P8I74_06925, partial [Phycisphaerales bacterium]|nr:hypothetical protein [Phycisphaerales bacterium]
MSGSTSSSGSPTPGHGPAPSINGWNAPYVESLYQQWIDDPESVDPQWIPFFEGFQLGYERMPDPAADADAPTASLPGHTTGGDLQSRV